MSRRARTLLAGLALLLPIAACSYLEPPVRVLFVGNSYTAGNDLAGMVGELAAAGGTRLQTGVIAPGGWWLRDHASSPGTMDAIASGKWDFVILQEQSLVPADPDLVSRSSYPSALELTTEARRNGAEVILFMTWGHRDGAPDFGHGSYSEMQIAVAGGYATLSGGLAARVAPVGAAWWICLAESPGIALYQPDGSHPTAAGSYLAAAVITATLLGMDPDMLDTPAGLDPGTAGILRRHASRAVNGEIPWREARLAPTSVWVEKGKYDST